MSKPTTEELLKSLDGVYSCYAWHLGLDRAEKEVDPFRNAIRARLLAYDKLEKNYTELLGRIKTLQNITEEAEESGGYYIWLRKMLFVAKSIRDYREGR